jgi:uncharacterized cupin superfamily protein
MLLYVSGPEKLAEAEALSFYADCAAAWPALAKKKTHPRSGQPCEPAQTRLDLFLAAFAPTAAAAPNGVRMQIVPPPAAAHWGLALRRALRELVQASFMTSARYENRMDPAGPVTATPSKELPPLLEQAATVPQRGDPNQKPVDPRLWLVVAPHLPEYLEQLFLPTFLRAEPYARVVRAPNALTGAELTAWLEREVDDLLAGKDLAVRGFVVRAEDAGLPSQVFKNDAGAEIMRSTQLEAGAATEDIYAWRTVIQPGSTSGRLHSHTGSEELYLVLEGEGHLRINERVIAVKAGDVFGKPRGYACATQFLNTGRAPLVLLDVGTLFRSELELSHYPEHGEVLARHAGHFWMAPTDEIRPGRTIFPFYQRSYYRTGAGPRETKR